jgi:negative regulator of flagellin synthesis FlgM
MPPIEVGVTRAIGAVIPDLTRKTSTDATSVNSNVANAIAAPSASVAAKSALATTAALEPGQAPVDADRVAQIRKAVESGSYPLVPTRIADAMIAAGMLLRSGQA